jgi:hypothetical protein
MPANTGRLPAKFKNDLISLSIPLDKDTLHVYTDTGGKNFLYKSGIKKLNIKRSKKNLWKSSNIESILKEKEIPIPCEREIYYLNDKSSNFDGMFGREWFGGKIWEFDYEHETLKCLNHYEKDKEKAAQAVSLYFKSDSEGNHTNYLPRIELIVKSDTLSMLFDSGAQAILSVEAQEKLHKNELVATSFINASTFKKWKNTHPEWTVLEGADLSFGEKSDIIIVPEVQIGNMTVGPVEFVERADPNFKVMSDFFMDKEIVGAIGGNALSQLKRFILDYKAEKLTIKN